jgi:hypothetical protein
MKWSELKKEIDEFLKDKDVDIIYIDTGNYPKKIDIRKSEFGFIVEKGVK